MATRKNAGSAVTPEMTKQQTKKKGGRISPAASTQDTLSDV
jgi:hypothetical protein